MRELAALALSTAFKVLLYPAYHSTDFDVHRNWMAITSKLPMKEWYYEHTNQWTLDYPPFFAYFEWLLAQFVPKCVEADGALAIVPVGHYGWPTIAFQRTTVVISEAVLIASLGALFKADIGLNNTQKRAVFALLWLSPAWLILDHIHFQYNGMMFGIFILSMLAAAQKRYLWTAFLYSSLLCFKHIYLYLAPAYFAFLLRAYIVPSRRIEFLNAIKLGMVTTLPFVLALGPFYGQLDQVFTRLFPFGRGLTHAYWAPNFWALYSFADRLLGVVRKNATVAGTRGLVGQVEFSNLPNITPRVTFLLTLFYQLVGIIPVLVKPSFHRFAGCLTVCAFASFFFGWHVHEKAIVLVIVPFTFIALTSRRLLAAYQTLLVAGYVSLLPLLFTPAEAVIKYVYTGIYILAALGSLLELSNTTVGTSSRAFVLERPAALYNMSFLLVLPVIQLAGMIYPKYEFAKLMLLSVYCSLGVLFSFVALCTEYFTVDLTGDK